MKTILAFLCSLCISAVIFVGCDSPFPGLRHAPNESQKQARDAAARIAETIYVCGLPPNTEAGAALAAATRESSIDAGLPTSPLALDKLIPAGTAQAWAITQKQLDALRLKLSVLLKAASDNPNMKPALDLSASIPIPPDPVITDLERMAAAASAQAVKTTAATASAAASNRPTVAEVASAGIDWANNWLEILVGTGVLGGSAAVALRKYLATAKAVRDAAAGNESLKRSTDQIVQGVQTFLNSPQPDAAKDALKLSLGGQDTATKVLVDQLTSKTTVQP